MSAINICKIGEQSDRISALSDQVADNLRLLPPKKVAFLHPDVLYQTICGELSIAIILSLLAVLAMAPMACTSVKEKAHLTGRDFILGSSSLGRMLDSSPPSASICKFGSSQSPGLRRGLSILGTRPRELPFSAGHLAAKTRDMCD